MLPELARNGSQLEAWEHSPIDKHVAGKYRTVESDRHGICAHNAVDCISLEVPVEAAPVTDIGMRILNVLSVDVLPVTGANVSWPHRLPEQRIGRTVSFHERSYSH